MKKKIGFIDLYIDEWHANNYPAWIRGGKYADEVEIHMAWQLESESREGLRSLEQWCKDFNVTPASSQEELIAECDYIIVLAPSNPEVHEELAHQALMSGKPLYMDKPFAPNKATAERIFALAAEHNTPMFSSSALRFSNEIADLKANMFKDGKIQFVSTIGGGSSYWEYCIHQLEIVTALLGTGATRLMHTATGDIKNVVIQYNDERSANITYSPNLGFQFTAVGKEHASVSQCSNFFPVLMDSMMNFFLTGENPVPSAETIEVAAMVGQSVAAQDSPNVWFEL